MTCRRVGPLPLVIMNAVAARLAEQTYLALTTYRRDGTAVRTPVWAAADDDQLLIWTPAASGKVQRVRNQPRVAVSPSTFDGSPTGPSVTGVARLLPRAGQTRARQAMTAKYGWKFREFAIMLGLIQVLRLDRIIRLSRVRRAAGGAVVIAIKLDPTDS
jgi:PPOX class probable F420-dependent enzyme